MTMKEYDDRYNPDPTPLLRMILGVILGIVLCGLLSLLVGCGTKTQVVEVPQVREVYVHQTDTLVRRDSVYFKDSVYIVQRGDTVYHNSYHTLYKDRLVYNTHTDTVHKTDTLTVVKTVEVEKKAGWWKRTLGKVEDMLVMALLIVGSVLLLRWWVNRK